ncbi:lysylphosphatidylglycerol synthase domain-containing protein [Paraburkholderia sp. UCT31]|uniref:lysylphosphatidylglycerol synthase domain-containing protein n=1 Tax=Paraburkholderia sp. UCT31 TaxID=2615209 RepID=UPI00292A50E4|nr:lysylphosphatidylglycerol synthase domain-containing protein [Paraburkholderia sp. UCT31]
MDAKVYCCRFKATDTTLAPAYEISRPGCRTCWPGHRGLARLARRRAEGARFDARGRRRARACRDGPHSADARQRVGESVRIDQSISELWHRPGVIIRYLLIWQSLQCIATALELWLALYFLSAKAGFLQAVVLESLIQALSSVAFFVPGALGVQEGGFLLIGTVLGFHPQLCLALAGARRIRDIIVFLPGLIAWQVEEWRDKRRLRTEGGRGPNHDGRHRKT